MTIEQIRATDKAVLKPADIAEVLGCHPYTVNVRAKNDGLPFPFFLSGSRVKIPRDGFIAWYEGRMPVKSNEKAPSYCE